jgi:hypothetical protein
MEALEAGYDILQPRIHGSPYKSDDDERVFVVDWQGDIEEVDEHSDTISTFRDRSEPESLLIVIDTAKAPKLL